MSNGKSLKEYVEMSNLNLKAYRSYVQDLAFNDLILYSKIQLFNNVQMKLFKMKSDVIKKTSNVIFYTKNKNLIKEAKSKLKKGKKGAFAEIDVLGQNDNVADLKDRMSKMFGEDSQKLAIIYEQKVIACMERERQSNIKYNAKMMKQITDECYFNLKNYPYDTPGIWLRPDEEFIAAREKHYKYQAVVDLKVEINALEGRIKLNEKRLRNFEAFRIEQLNARLEKERLEKIKKDKLAEKDRIEAARLNKARRRHKFEKMKLLEANVKKRRQGIEIKESKPAAQTLKTNCCERRYVRPEAVSKAKVFERYTYNFKKEIKEENVKRRNYKKFKEEDDKKKGIKENRTGFKIRLKPEFEFIKQRRPEVHAILQKKEKHRYRCKVHKKYNFLMNTIHPSRFPVNRYPKAPIVVPDLDFKVVLLMILIYALMTVKALNDTCLSLTNYYTSNFSYYVVFRFILYTMFLVRFTVPFSKLFADIKIKQSLKWKHLHKLFIVLGFCFFYLDWGWCFIQTLQYEHFKPYTRVGQMLFTTFILNSFIMFAFKLNSTIKSAEILAVVSMKKFYVSWTILSSILNVCVFVLYCFEPMASFAVSPTNFIYCFETLMLIFLFIRMSLKSSDVLIRLKMRNNLLKMIALLVLLFFGTLIGTTLSYVMPDQYDVYYTFFAVNNVAVLNIAEMVANHRFSVKMLKV
jgi:hypothetical protein